MNAFREALTEHIKYVKEAGEMLGVDTFLLDIHDQSKRSAFELEDYARQFKGAKDDPNGFANAWLHHIHNNPHHWQHWIFPDGYTLKGSDIENGVTKMPRTFVLEMIADWLGASMAYTGSWNIADWLRKNISRIIVHSETARFLRHTLSSSNLGYNEVICNILFKNGV